MDSNTQKVEERINAAQRELEEAKAELERLKTKVKPKQRFYRDQPVLVRNSDGQQWRRRYYAKSGEVSADGKTSRITGILIPWNQIKPDPNAPSLLNWQEWCGGKQPVPDDALIVIQTRAGGVSADFANTYDWRHDEDSLSDITLYAIITLPEWEDEGK